MKLGKLPVRHDHRTLRLASYLSVLPTLPALIDWGGHVPSWGMMLNDSLGDCTCAAAGHLEQVWSSSNTAPYNPPDGDILSAYESIGGYQPNSPSTDQGCNALDVLNFWRNSGISGHKIQSYVSVNPQIIDEVRASIALFGGIYVGVQLPTSAMQAYSAGQPWVNISDTQIEGGHAICIIAYDANTLTCITWGRRQVMTWSWFQKYCDEAYGILSPDWIGNNGISPSGLNLDQLNADLSLIHA